MTIKEKDFIIEQDSDYSLLYNLQLLVKTKSKEGVESMSMKQAGYGMPLLVCLKMVAANRVSNKHTSDVSLAVYVKDLKEAYRELSNYATLK